jgi:hypothetical protein
MIPGIGIEGRVVCGIWGTPGCAVDLRRGRQDFVSYFGQRETQNVAVIEGVVRDRMAGRNLPRPPAVQLGPPQRCPRGGAAWNTVRALACQGLGHHFM